jgi:hypothetical protein
MNQFTPSPEYSIKTISKFFENLRRYSQFKVHQRHRQKIFPPVSLALSICHRAGVVDAGGKLPVSTTQVANNGSNYQTADNLKGLSHEIDFKNVDKNLQN